ncbi:MAG: glycosyltransferase [Firmicutes bacterium]|nr:glycosyltransferase [Candidatus Fermentithermobacillaceae bacterium]
MKLKIAFFSDSFRDDLGGLTKAVTGLHDALISQGHQVTVFTLPQKTKPLHSGDVIFVPALPLSGLPGIPSDSYFGYGYARVLKALQSIKPDIVHVHTVYPVGWIGLLAAAKLKIAAVATYHANIKIALSLLTQRSPGQQSRHPGGADANSFKKGSRVPMVNNLVQGAARLADRGISAGARSFYNRFNAVIAPSEFAANSLRSFGVTAPIHVIPSGIDTRLFSPSPSGTGLSEYVPSSMATCAASSFPRNPAEPAEHISPCNVLYAGRLSAEKGVETLIRVVKTLGDEWSPDDGDVLKGTNVSGELRFTIAGDGPLRRRLERDLKYLVEQGTVEFRGFVPWDRMPDEYRRAQVFFLPSPAETQGLAALEAMASGLPVVAVKAGAIPEFVEHGKSGFLFEPEDTEGMSNAIRNLAADPGLRRRVGEKARARAMRFDWRELVGKFIDLYTQYLRC